MKEYSNDVDIIDPVDTALTSPIIHPEYSIVGISPHAGVDWTPSKGNLFCFVVVSLFDMLSYLYFLICCSY